MAFGGGFGQSSSTLFGSSQPSLFGAPSQPTGLFGNAGMSAPAMSSSAFGQAIPSANSLWGTQAGFGGSQPAVGQGTRAAKWQVSQLYDSSGASEASKFHSISAMEPFREFSVEELRLQDYSRGDKGGEQASAQQGAFGGAFGAQSQSAFGSGFGGAQSAGAFGAGSSALGAGGNTGFGASSSAFGASAAFGATGGTGFGGGMNQGFGGAGSTGFGAQSSAFGGQSTGFGAQSTGFGAQSSGFGAQSMGFGSSGGAFGAGAPQSSAFGAAGQSSGFGAAFAGASSSGFGAGTFSSSAFGASSSAAPLFGAATASQPAGGGIFGGASSQQNPATSLFGAPSAAGLGASGAFGGGFGGNTGAQSAPSLFGGGFGLGGLGAASGASSSGGLFGASGASLGLGSTGTNLFGGGFGASTSGPAASGGGSLFGGGQTGFGLGLGSGFGAGMSGGFGSGAFGASMPQQQQMQQLVQQTPGPLQASLTASPFGDSRLFAGLAYKPGPQPNSAGASVVNTAGAAGQPQARPVSVVVGSTSKVHRRTRNSEVLARHNVMRRRSPGRGWFPSSPMRPWGEEGSLFNVGSAMRANPEGRGLTKPQGLQKYETSWRSEEQKARIANLKRLVIEPLPDDPVLRHASVPQNSHQEAAQNGVRSQGEDPGAGVGTPAARTAGGNVGRPSLFRPDVGRSTGLFGSRVGSVVASDASPESDALGRESTPGQPAMESRGIDVEAETEAGDLGSEQNLGESEQVGVGEERPGQFIHNDFRQSQTPVSGEIEGMVRPGGRQTPTSMRSLVPKITSVDVTVEPSLQEMSRMAEDELSRVENFTLSKDGIGKITWLEPTDVRGLDIDAIVDIKPREISVYPQDEDVPPVGQGLNKLARIQLFGISKVDKYTKKVKKDAATAAKMVARLKAHCESEGLQFLGYDIASGTWTFQASSF